MTKWEYCEIEVTIGGPISGMKAEGWKFNANGKHVKFKGKHGTLFADLGLNGWEIVASSARISSGLSSKHKINYICFASDGNGKLAVL